MTPDSGTLADGPGRPSGPGVYDYLLGGTDNDPADRVLAKRLIAEYPALPQLSRDNRAFVLKAVRWLAAIRDVRQFIDVGAGLPASPAVHEVAREAGLVSVAYVDKDPVVVNHLRAVLQDEGPGIAVTAGDAEDPASVLADPSLLEVTDLSRPAAVVFGGTLSCMDAAVAAEAVAGFMAPLPPGSAAVISCASFGDEAEGAKMAAMYGAACAWRSHSREDVASFFSAAGLRLVRGRVAPVASWPMLPACEDGTAILGGVGIKD